MNKAKFFSVLSNRSTDSALIENEIIYFLHFDPSPIGSDLVEVKCSFLPLNYLRDLSSDGVHTAIADSIEKTLESLEISSTEKKTWHLSIEAKMTVSKQN